MKSVEVAYANELGLCIDDFEWLCRKFIRYWSNFRDRGVWYWYYSNV